MEVTQKGEVTAEGFACLPPRLQITLQAASLPQASNMLAKVKGNAPLEPYSENMAGVAVWSTEATTHTLLLCYKVPPPNMGFLFSKCSHYYFVKCIFKAIVSCLVPPPQWLFAGALLILFRITVASIVSIRLGTPALE